MKTLHIVLILVFLVSNITCAEYNLNIAKEEIQKNIENEFRKLTDLESSIQKSIWKHLETESEKYGVDAFNTKLNYFRLLELIKSRRIRDLELIDYWLEAIIERNIDSWNRIKLKLISQEPKITSIFQTPKNAIKIKNNTEDDSLKLMIFINYKLFVDSKLDLTKVPKYYQSPLFLKISKYFNEGLIKINPFYKKATYLYNKYGKIESVNQIKNQEDIKIYNETKSSYQLLNEYSEKISKLEGLMYYELISNFIYEAKTKSIIYSQGKKSGFLIDDLKVFNGMSEDPIKLGNFIQEVIDELYQPRVLEKISAESKLFSKKFNEKELNKIHEKHNELINSRIYKRIEEKKAYDLLLKNDKSK